jgi:hypothetical protein
MLEVIDHLILHDLDTDLFTVRSKRTSGIGVKAFRTVHLQAWCGSNTAKYLWCYVRGGTQHTKSLAGLVFDWVWKRTQLNLMPKSGLLAGYRNPVLTLPR